MKSKQTYDIQCIQAPKKIDLVGNPEFLNAIQTAVLQSFLESGQLTEQQFELCVDRLRS